MCQGSRRGGRREPIRLRSGERAEVPVMGPARTGSPEAVLTVAGRDIRLTATEFDLLRVRSAVRGRIVTTEVLVRHSVENRGSGDTDRLRTALKKLPRKARRRHGQSPPTSSTKTASATASRDPQRRADGPLR